MYLGITPQFGRLLRQFRRENHLAALVIEGLELLQAAHIDHAGTWHDQDFVLFPVDLVIQAQGITLDDAFLIKHLRMKIREIP